MFLNQQHISSKTKNNKKKLFAHVFNQKTMFEFITNKYLSKYKKYFTSQPSLITLYIYFLLYQNLLINYQNITHETGQNRNNLQTL